MELRTYTDLLPLGSSMGTEAGKAPEAYREKLKCLAPGRVPEDSFLQDNTPEARQWHLPLSELSPTQSSNIILETPSTWFPWIAHLPKALPHPTFRCTILK